MADLNLRVCVFERETEVDQVTGAALLRASCSHMCVQRVSAVCRRVPVYLNLSHQL